MWVSEFDHHCFGFPIRPKDLAPNLCHLGHLIHIQPQYKALGRNPLKQSNLKVEILGVGLRGGLHYGPRAMTMKF
jgi:hypothetical protein